MFACLSGCLVGSLFVFLIRRLCVCLLVCFSVRLFGSRSVCFVVCLVVRACLSVCVFVSVSPVCVVACLVD